MASGFFALMDDIAYLMDDIATASKIATRKTAAILGDDLAVNAKNASGYASSRELPVLWAITKGSFINKLIILPIIFLLNYYAPIMTTVLLMIGGVYLAYEGAEKIYEYLFHKGEEEHEHKKILGEKEKIKDAIMTDLILSLEIVIVALSTVQNEPLVTKIVSVSIAAFVATIGVYGLVALIVRMDDMGIFLVEKYDGIVEMFGKLLISLLPKIIKILSVVGTFAMLLVAGGIYLHHIEQIHKYLHSVPTMVAEFIVGSVIGVVAFALIETSKKVFASQKA
ncbi:MAG: DUF808 domain-containing protein [Epsilonproteobacteria bacterium]|nr:DUF808 domain-containing protein [Campylobacterota bacterium]